MTVGFLKPTKLGFLSSPLDWLLQAAQPSKNIQEKRTCSRRNREWSPRQIHGPVPSKILRSLNQSTQNRPKPWYHDDFCISMGAVSLETKNRWFSLPWQVGVETDQADVLEVPASLVASSTSTKLKHPRETDLNPKKPQMKPSANQTSYPAPRSIQIAISAHPKAPETMGTSLQTVWWLVLPSNASCEPGNKKGIFGARDRWFFETDKAGVLEFPAQLVGSSSTTKLKRPRENLQ